MESNNKRVARNTLLLYFRMLFLSGISFFTVRIILEALGVIDYGIMNVISSLVASLSFLNGTLSSATQRYFSYFLGKNDIFGYKKIFSILLICYIVVCFSVLLIGEFLGFFFLNDWLVIPDDRMYAAKWVFQTSLISFIFQLCVIPFTASLIAHERMNGFAYISILDGLFKLLIAYLIFYSTYDKLIFYGILTAIESIIVFICYLAYCRINFDGCRFVQVWEKGLFFELLGYTGWNLFGSISGMLAGQGQNILLNIYFGPVINAAKGISDRITSVIQSFSTNFYVAVAPQIVKSYANGDLSRMYMLVTKSTKFSFLLLILLSYPLIICIEALLYIWLGRENVESEMVSFCRLALIYCLVTTIEQPITQMIRATGHIKKYQLGTGIITLCFIPLAALIFHIGCEPVGSMYLLIILYSFVQFIRVYIAKHQVNFPIKVYLKESIYPILLVSITLMIASYFLVQLNDSSFGATSLKLLLSFITATIVSIALGLSKNEKDLLLIKITTVIKNRSLRSIV